MKTILHFILITFLAGAFNLACTFAAEPPVSRSLVEKARMATHVVVGSLESIQVIDRASGRAIASPADILEDGQCFEASVVIGEIIGNDQVHPLDVGDHLKVRFGGRRSTLSVIKEALHRRPLIYWLSRDQEMTRRDNFFFPFYGETTLCDLLERKNDAVAAVARIAACLK